MRVITGTAKGRALKAPKGLTTRPTTDRVKEALFNILGPKVVGAKFLDLFAGSGGIGIEALSRGAQEALFIEKDPKALDVIKANLVLTGLGHRAMVLSGDVYKNLDYIGRQGQEFEFVFMDPPYLKDFEEPVLAKIDSLKLLALGGKVIVESSKRDNISTQVGSLAAFRREKYGDTHLTFYSQTEF